MTPVTTEGDLTVTTTALSEGPCCRRVARPGVARWHQARHHQGRRCGWSATGALVVAGRPPWRRHCVRTCHHYGNVVVPCHLFDRRVNKQTVAYCCNSFVVKIPSLHWTCPACTWGGHSVTTCTGCGCLDTEMAASGQAWSDQGHGEASSGPSYTQHGHV